MYTNAKSSMKPKQDDSNHIYEHNELMKMKYKENIFKEIRKKDTYSYAKLQMISYLIKNNKGQKKIKQYF